MAIIQWLISLFIHPKQESNTMSEPLNDAASSEANSQPSSTIVQQQFTVTAADGAIAVPTQEVKTGVKDFEAALKFVESGVSQLGSAAKDELKALAVKYL